MYYNYGVDIIVGITRLNNYAPNPYFNISWEGIFPLHDAATTTSGCSIVQRERVYIYIRHQIHLRFDSRQSCDKVSAADLDWVEW